MPFDPIAWDKRLIGEPKGVEILQHLRELVAASSSIDQETLEPQIKALAELQGVKLGVCINALRIALTGKATGLGIFDTFSILGRDRALARIDRCLERAHAL
jgi:glutamyl-tRNA synthetase